jgi:hypothetical protein
MFRNINRFGKLNQFSKMAYTTEVSESSETSFALHIELETAYRSIRLKILDLHRYTILLPLMSIFIGPVSLVKSL